MRVCLCVRNKNIYVYFQLYIVDIAYLHILLISGYANYCIYYFLRVSFFFADLPSNMIKLRTIFLLSIIQYIFLLLLVYFMS